MGKSNSPVTRNLHFCKGESSKLSRAWILPKPLLIGEAKGYKFYIGTQIGGAGTSLMCENCKSAVKFYWSKSVEENKKISKILKAAICPFCGKVADVSKLGETLNLMTVLATKFKRELWGYAEN